MSSGIRYNSFMSNIFYLCNLRIFFFFFLFVFCGSYAISASEKPAQWEPLQGRTLHSLEISNPPSGPSLGTLLASRVQLRYCAERDLSNLTCVVQSTPMMYARNFPPNAPSPLESVVTPQTRLPALKALTDQPLYRRAVHSPHDLESYTSREGGLLEQNQRD